MIDRILVPAAILAGFAALVAVVWFALGWWGLLLLAALLASGAATGLFLARVIAHRDTQRPAEEHAERGEKP